MNDAQTDFDVQALAARFVAARRAHSTVAHETATPPNREAAVAVQDATLRALSAQGEWDAAGWKVGAKSVDDAPQAAPLPPAGFFSSGVALAGPAWRERGVELEVAVRLKHDLVPRDGPPDAPTVRAAVGEILPAIEVVETRLAGWREADPMAKLADLQSHGALVLGAPSSVAPEDLDLRNVQAYLAFDGQPVATTRGANPAGDIWRLLSWLAWHAVQRGQPLRAGQVVTTGSCTGMLFAPEGAHVVGELMGFGRVELRF